MKSITCVGIDASKDRLEILIDRPNNKRLCVSNDREGIVKLKKELGDGDYVIALEASGRYESLARHELTAAGYTVKLQNPRQVRRLAEGLGRQAKTDSLDAQFLASTAELCAPNEPRSKEREALSDLSRTIERLKLQRTGHMRRIQVPGFCPIAAKILRRLVASIERQIRNLEMEFLKMVKQSSLAQRYTTALSVPNVGPNLARTGICELPEKLHSWSIRQLSAYAGVAPIDESSGKKNPPPRVSRHSNVHLKAALYMPAMGAIQKQDWAARLYSRLRARGLTHQQAIVPVMHKILFHLVAVLKRGSAWEAEPPKKT
jgi:transposase